MPGVLATYPWPVGVFVDTPQTGDIKRQRISDYSAGRAWTIHIAADTLQFRCIYNEQSISTRQAEQIIHYIGSLPSALRAQIAERLPVYMVPSAYMLLDQLPLTPNGKLNRLALPPPDGSGLVQGRYIAPQGAIEAALADIWQNLLNVERVGRNDHFFELGGHSLLAVRLVGLISHKLSVSLPLLVVFCRPDLLSQAEAVENRLAVAVTQ